MGKELAFSPVTEFVRVKNDFLDFLKIRGKIYKHRRKSVDLIRDCEIEMTTLTELPIRDYQTLSEQELFDRITEAKAKLGKEVLVLGHNYQRDEVIVHADLRGDSLLLAKYAAELSEFPTVVFCGDRKSVV